MTDDNKLDKFEDPPMIKIIKKLISHANELAQWIPDEPHLASEEEEAIFTRMWDEHEAIIKEAEKLLRKESKLARFNAICDKIAVEVTDVVTVSEGVAIRATVDAGGDYVFCEVDPDDCVRALVNITRLWNWADQEADGTPYWDILKARFPLAFRDRSNTNSLRFTYN
tara:strand:- start:633 stop:1136 length:504 start_codon:yes stop_codon:yes gene_type:complete